MRTFDQLAPVGLAGGDFEGDDVALGCGCASLAGGCLGFAVGWKGWGIAYLGLVQKLDWNADCGRHFDGGVCVLECGEKSGGKDVVDSLLSFSGGLAER